MHLLKIYERILHSSYFKNFGKEIDYGFPPLPKGLSKTIFIDRPITKERIRESNLVILEENNKKITFKIKGTNINLEVEKNKIIKGLRTVASLNKINITTSTDYIITEKINDLDVIYKHGGLHIKNFETIKERLKGKTSHIALIERCDLTSPNTHLTSFYSDEKFVPTNVFYIFPSMNKEDAKILSLFFNSIIFIFQFILFRKEIRDGWGKITKEELSFIKYLDISHLLNSQKQKLLELFEEIKDKEFPSLYEQFKEKYPLRVKLDDTILKILGFEENERKEIIEKTYRAIVEEIDAMKEIMKV